MFRARRLGAALLPFGRRPSPDLPEANGAAPLVRHSRDAITVGMGRL